MEPAWLAASAACAAAIAGWWAAFNGVRTLRQARKDSKNRGRPMLAAELRRIPYVKATLTLVIRNLGPTIARNVRVTFDPPIPDPDPQVAAQSVTPFLKRRYAQPIATFTPGMELANVWFVGRPGDGGQWQNAEPTPERCVVTLCYESTDGTEYKDEFNIDVALMRAETYSTSSAAPEALMKEAVKSLKAIERSLTQLVRGNDGSRHDASANRGLAPEVIDRLLGHQRDGE